MKNPGKAKATNAQDINVFGLNDGYYVIGLFDVVNSTSGKARFVVGATQYEDEDSAKTASKKADLDFTMQSQLSAATIARECGIATAAAQENAMKSKIQWAVRLKTDNSPEAARTYTDATGKEQTFQPQNCTLL